MGLKRIKMIFK